MTIEVNRIGYEDVVAFAERHGLKVVVNERKRPEGDPGRFYANFGVGCDIMDGGCLVGSFGDGATPDAAIAAWAKRVQLQRIAVGAFTPERHEIEVPRLTYEPREEEPRCLVQKSRHEMRLAELRHNAMAPQLASLGLVEGSLPSEYPVPAGESHDC